MKKVRIALLLCWGMNHALAGEFIPYYDYTKSVTIGFSISGSTANCSGMVKPSKSDYKATVTVKLQQKDGGWTTIETWTGSAAAGKTASASGNKELTSGYEYRVVVSGEVKDANDKVVERPSKTSSTKSY